MESSEAAPGNARTDTVIVSKNRYAGPEMCDNDGMNSVNAQPLDSLNIEPCSSRADEHGTESLQFFLSLPDNEDNQGSSETVEHELTYGKFFFSCPRSPGEFP